MKLMPIEDLKRLPVKVGAFFMYFSIIRKLIPLTTYKPAIHLPILLQ